MSYTNRARWGGRVDSEDKGSHTLKAGRTRYLADGTARPDSAKAKTTVRHYVRKGREAYVNDVNGGRKS